jgi:MFS family permease
MSDIPEKTTGPEQPDWRSIAAVTAGISILSAMMGLTYPLLAFNLNRWGVSPTMIGINAAMMGLGLLLAGWIMPRVIMRIGLRRAAILCITGTTAVFALYPLFPGLVPWFPIRLAHGFISSGIFIICDTWINQLAPSRLRGRIIGIYATVFALGFAVGPAILTVTGSEGWTPYIAGICCGVVALIGLLLGKDEGKVTNDGGHDSGSVAGFVLIAPALLIAILGFGIFESGLLSLLPIYLLDFGHLESDASVLLATFIVGSALMQLPIGMIADRLPGRTMFFVCTAIAVLSPVLLPVLARDWVPLLVLFFLWGGFAFGIYTLSMKELGDRFSGQALVTGNAAFAMAWSLGNLVGPAISGGMTAVAGLVSLPAFLGGAFAPVLVIAAIRTILRGRQRKQDAA